MTKIGTALKKLVNPFLFVEAMMLIIMLIYFPFVGEFARSAAKILPLWGVIVILVHIKRIKAVFRAKYYFLLILFSCSYLVTVLVNYQYHLVQNLKALIWYALYIGILLVWWRLVAENTGVLYREVKKINWLLVGVNLLNVVPTAVIFLLNIHIQFEGRPIGIYDTRLYGVMAELNASVMLAFVSVLACIMNWRMDEEKAAALWVKLLYGLNILLSYLFVIASGTRAVRYILAGTVALYAFITIYKRWTARKTFREAILPTVGSMVTGVVILFVSYWGIEATRLPIGRLPWGQISESDKPEDGDSGGVSPEENDTSAEEDLLGEALLGNVLQGIRDPEGERESTRIRSGIWKECIALWKEYPLWGVGNANLKAYADKSENEFNYINVDESGASTHGMPIAVLVYSGTMGSIILFGYLLLRGLKAVLTVLRKGDRNTVQGNVLLFSFLMCVGWLVYSFFGTIIVFSNVTGTVLFWIQLGIFELAEKDVERDAEKDAEQQKMLKGEKCDAVCI